MSTFTPNYGLEKPDDSDLMSNFEDFINLNWDRISDVVAPNSGTTLPQAGDYDLGDRFYKSDTKSIYILVVKDANWGWHWRPIHDGISPWLTVPSTCLQDINWTVNPVPADPFQIALDNKGECYWRGVIGTTPGNITRNTSYNVFKPLPHGIRPRLRGAYMLGHETVSVGTNGNNLNSWQGGRIFLYNTEDDFPTVRTFGGTADFNRVYLTGVRYLISASAINPGA